MTDMDEVWKATRAVGGLLLMLGALGAMFFEAITVFQYAVLWALGVLMIDYGMSESDVEEMIQDAVGEKIGELCAQDNSKGEVRLNVEVVDE